MAAPEHRTPLQGRQGLVAAAVPLTVLVVLVAPGAAALVHLGLITAQTEPQILVVVAAVQGERLWRIELVGLVDQVLLLFVIP
jgi:hypothetical protein